MHVSQVCVGKYLNSWQNKKDQTLVAILVFLILFCSKTANSSSKKEHPNKQLTYALYSYRYYNLALWFLFFRNTLDARFCRKSLNLTLSCKIISIKYVSFFTFKLTLTNQKKKNSKNAKKHLARRFLFWLSFRNTLDARFNLKTLHLKITLLCKIIGMYHSLPLN